MSFTPEEEKRITAVETGITSILDLVENLTKKVSDVDKKTIKKATGLFGMKRTKTAIKDVTTGIVHASKSAVGKALYKEIEDGDPADRFIWYKLLAKFPDRFEELDSESAEAKKVWEDEKAETAKETADRQAKLDAEAKKAKS